MRSRSLAVSEEWYEAPSASIAPQPIDLLFNTANNASASTTEGKLAEDSFKDLIVGMQDPVRAKPDDVFRQFTAVVVDRPKLGD